MTQQEKLKAIVNNTDGMCWHEGAYNYEEPCAGRTLTHSRCGDCDEFFGRGSFSAHEHRPSHDSVDDLLRIAERRNLMVTIDGADEPNCWLAHVRPRKSSYHEWVDSKCESTPAAALLEAMWQTLPKKEG